MLLDVLKAGAANRKTTRWPGTEEEIAIRILTEQDYHEAGMAADKLYEAAKIQISMQNIADYEAEKDLQALWRAIVDATTGERIFATIVDFRKALTKGARDVLTSEVNAFQEECSPDPGKMKEEEFDTLYDSVKKNAGTTPMNVSSISLLRRLVMSLAKELANSRQDNGSTS